MKPGSVALARVQQADGQLKPRPVIVLNTMPPFGDYLVCALSSRLQHKVLGFDEVIEENDSDFEQSGLKVPSLIRLGLVATIPKRTVLGQLGTIADDRLERLRERLAQRIKAEDAGGNAPPRVPHL